MSRPWMPLYVADYLADTRRLSTLEHGAYLLLIMDYWQNGSLPENDEALARISGLGLKEWAKVKTAIASLFHDGWKHKRIDAELQRSEDKSQSARSSAAASWRSRRNADADANAMRTHSDGTSEQPAHARVSQPQSQDLINPNGFIAGAGAPADPIQIERDRTKIAEERSRLRVLGQDWNILAADLRLPQIEEIESGSRRERAALARLREGKDFSRVFAKIRASPFLRGDRGSTPCSFDWIINPTNFQKIVEGNYDEIRKDSRPIRAYGASR